MVSFSILRPFADRDAPRRSFKCADQVQWGVVPDEASCDIPEPSFGEDDVVFDCSSLPDAAIVEGAKVDACVDIKVQLVLQFGVSRGLGEVLLAPVGRVYLSGIVAEFGPLR